MPTYYIYNSIVTYKDENQYALNLNSSCKVNRQDIRRVLKNILHIEYLVTLLRTRWDVEPLEDPDIKEIIELIKRQIKNIKSEEDETNITYHILARNKIFSIANEEHLFQYAENFKIFVLDQFENFTSSFFEIYIESESDIPLDLHKIFKDTLEELIQYQAPDSKLPLFK